MMSALRTGLMMSFILICGASCFGPVEPTHPLDPEAPLASQDKSSLSLNILTPNSTILSGYLSLRTLHSPDFTRRLYLEDFKFEGRTTQSDGSSWAIYHFLVEPLDPGIYALQSSIADLELEGQTLFELSPGTESMIELELKPN